MSSWKYVVICLLLRPILKVAQHWLCHPRTPANGVHLYGSTRATWQRLDTLWAVADNLVTGLDGSRPKVPSIDRIRPSQGWDRGATAAAATIPGGPL